VDINHERDLSDAKGLEIEGSPIHLCWRSWITPLK
jgi:hypothetical protein